MNVEAVSYYITNWIKDYVKDSGMNGMVVGVSGGVDSALTATLCARTGLPLRVVEMPIHQAAGQVNRAEELILHLRRKYPNVTPEKFDLTPVFESFKEHLPDEAVAYGIDHPAKMQLSLANTRARLRMTALYFYAGLYGLLVVGTGNKIEDFGVGFFTKYGDGGVDISPIADLMKSEVYALAGYLGVPESILKAAPTDGLFGDNRTDEDQLGASYDELEWAMNLKNEKNTSHNLTPRQKEVWEIYQKWNRANRHKMEPIPVCHIPEHIRNQK